MAATFDTRVLSWIILVGTSAAIPAGVLDARVNNGLARTPPMGWNSYNHYSCSPNEAIIKSNAQALVDLGLNKLGYNYVTTDCGWPAINRTSDGKMTWDSNLFPSGFHALGNFLHGLNLKFGIYSDSGIKMCNAYGQTAPAGSLGYESVDAATFASWGADALKFDNCYAEQSSGYPQTDYTPPTSPSSRFQKMADAIKSTGRSILYSICDWGVDFPSAWAPAMGNSWRVTNDIIPAWKTVYRIVNQVVPQTSFAGPGQWLDLDMLEVGNGIFTDDEERTHFTLWSILKSPLIIGGRLKDSQGSISQSSLNILSNKAVISYNQDSLGVAANLTRRYTQEGYDVWSGPLSGDRMVVALINWNSGSTPVTFKLQDVGLQSASAYDAWANKQLSTLRNNYTTTINGHGVVLLELSQLSPAGTYNASYSKTVSNGAVMFSGVYGKTTSSGFSATVYFSSATKQAQTLTVTATAGTSTQTVAVTNGATSVTFPLALAAGYSNGVTLAFSSSNNKPAISSLKVTPPQGTFVPATSFKPGGSATLTSCSTGGCAPVGSKIGYLTPSGSAVATVPRASASVSPSSSSSSSGGSGTITRYVELTYCNNDIALSSAFGDGRNARNLTLAVNGAAPVRLEVPLAGRSSELFAPGLGWDDSATLGVLVPGFGVTSGSGGGASASDTLVVGNVGGAAGVQSFGADFIGLRIY